MLTPLASSGFCFDAFGTRDASFLPVESKAQNCKAGSDTERSQEVVGMQKIVAGARNLTSLIELSLEAGSTESCR